MNDVAASKVIETLAFRILELEERIEERDPILFAAKRAIAEMGREAIKAFVREMHGNELITQEQINQELLDFYEFDDIKFRAELTDILKPQEKQS